MKPILRRFIPLIVVAGGILFIVLGFVNVGKQNSYKEVAGKIVDIQYDYAAANDDEADYNVTVEYEVDGHTYTELLGEYKSTMNVGDDIALKYNPENPRDIVTDGNTFIIIAFAFGTIAVIGGIFSFLKGLAR